MKVHACVIDQGVSLPTTDLCVLKSAIDVDETVNVGLIDYDIPTILISVGTVSWQNKSTGRDSLFDLSHPFNYA